MYDVPFSELNFDGWFETSVRLWPGNKKARSIFLVLGRTPPISPDISFLSFEIGIADTVF